LHDTGDSILIREARESDLPEIVEIYNDSVLTSTATFESVLQTADTRRKWFNSHGRDHPFIVATSNGKVLGYCCVSQFPGNSGYRKTGELSLYVEKTNRRKGIAKCLMTDILARARTLGFHAIISSISFDNEPSARLHEHFGFLKVAHLREVGFKFSRWQDTCYYELILT
jgi:L-amino acid N-acyltransferase